MYDSSIIAALATPPGKSGVAVVRVSGQGLERVITALGITLLPKTRHATLKTLIDPHDNAILDHALVLFFPAPHSFTGEDVLEFHIHGSPYVLQRLMDILCHHDACRLAQPGEFSRRAFLNGKFDLTQAEAISDLVQAESQAQHRLAMRQMHGELEQLYADWRARILHAMAFLEASIDFPEEDIPNSVMAEMEMQIRELHKHIANHLADGERGQRVREGLHIAIIGPPNAGKSTLLNYLARTEAAIVSPIPGTTRDAIQVHLILGGYAVTVTDTAGIRESEDAIEQLGIEKSRYHSDTADIRILVLEADFPQSEYEAFLPWINERTLTVVNKYDDRMDSLPDYNLDAIAISLKEGYNLDDFLQKLIDMIAHHYVLPASPVLTRQRHRAALEKANRYLEAVYAVDAIELKAMELRSAAFHLGSITGNIDVESVLDVVFSSFCIGK